MRKRLLLSTCLIALTTVVVLGVPLALVGTDLLHQRADARLEKRADAAALRLANARATGRPLTLAVLAPVLQKGEAVRFTADGRTQTLGAVPSGRSIEVHSGDGGSLNVILLASASERNDDVGVVWLAVGGFGLAALLAAVVLATVQSGRLARPLEQLAARVPRVGHGDYDHRPVAGHLAEIDQLQDALNEADTRIEALVRREREFTTNASHQLRSPLTGLRLRLEELARTDVDANVPGEIEAAVAQVDRLTETIEHLEDHARRRDDQPGLIDVSEVLAEHLERESWPARFGDAQRSLKVQLASRPLGHISPEALRQIADVLLENALLHGRGIASLSVTGDTEWVHVTVSDGGTSLGRDPEIFKRGVGHGNGIGLAVARELARHAGGDLRVTDDPRTTFEALIPR